MSSESDPYEIPPHQLEVKFSGKRLGEGKEMGEAVVVSTLFGRAKVRIKHEQDYSTTWFWPLILLVLVGVGAVFWWLEGAPQLAQPEQVMALPDVMPEEPASEPAAASNSSDISAIHDKTQMPTEQQSRSSTTSDKIGGEQTVVHSPELVVQKHTSVAKPKTKSTVAADKARQLHKAAKPQVAIPVVVPASGVSSALQPSIRITKNPVTPADSAVQATQH